MSRDIKKAIQDYNKKFLNSDKGQFHCSDFMQIKEMSNNDIWDLIANGMSAGFIIGYRFAKREMKKQQ